MLTPQALERATPGFRRGYNDARNGRPRAAIDGGVWEACDYAEGYAAAEKEASHERSLSERLRARRQQEPRP
jgi:hypothetical protein